MQQKEAPKPPKMMKKKEHVLPHITASSDNYCRLHDDAQVGDVTSIAQLFQEYGGWHLIESIDACRRGQNTALQ
jgi:hypothetical protein